MKKILFFIPFLIFANDFQNNFSLNKSLIRKLKYDYQYNRIKTSLNNQTKQETIEPTKQILKLLPQYKNFLKEKYPKILNNYEKVISNNYYTPTIFYFTSTSVPRQDFYNILLSIHKLQKYFEIKTAQIYKYIDPNLLKYQLKELKKDRENNSTINSILNNEMEFRFDAKSFKKLKIDKVPVIAFAMCKESIYPSDCNIKYIIRGDVSLTKFFFLISEKDSNYNPYYKALISP